MYLNLDGAKADTATAVNSVTVDWGDGTPKEKFIAAVYTSHKYADTGYYTICVQDGANKADYAKFGFSYIGVASNPPMNKLPIAIRKLSPKVKTFAAKSLCGCPNLSSISIDGGNSLNFPFTGFAVGAFDGYNNVQELSVRGCGAFVSNDAAGKSPFQPLENWKVMRQGSFADNFKYNANRTTSSAFKQLNIGMTHLTAIEDGALSGNQALAGVALYDIASTSNKLRKVGENVFD